MIIDEDVYLEHFGTKGMRWGVRKRRNEAERAAKFGPKKDRHGKFKKKSILSTRDKVVLGTAATYLTANAVFMDMQTRPGRYIDAGRFVNKTAKASYSVASKAAKGAKLLFEKDMVVFSPGTIKPGTYPSAAFIPKALGVGS